MSSDFLTRHKNHAKELAKKLAVIAIDDNFPFDKEK